MAEDADGGGGVVEVLEWRRLVLMQAGYPADDVWALADDPGVDLHVAVYLVESGCPLATALRILR